MRTPVQCTRSTPSTTVHQHFHCLHMQTSDSRLSTNSCANCCRSIVECDAVHSNPQTALQRVCQGSVTLQALQQTLSYRNPTVEMLMYGHTREKAKQFAAVGLWQQWLARGTLPVGTQGCIIVRSDLSTALSKKQYCVKIRVHGCQTKVNLKS